MSKLKKLNRLNKSKTLSVALAVGLVASNLVSVVPAFAATPTTVSARVLSVASSKIGSSSATFDKYKPKDIVVKLTLNGNTLDGITNDTDDSELVLDSDYIISEDEKTVTISQDYLGQLENGRVKLKFDFSEGTDRVLSVTVKNTAPSAKISPSSASFDQNKPKDLAVRVTLNGNTLEGITDVTSDMELELDSDYTISEDQKTVTISESYFALKKQGTLKLNFDFSNGNDPVLSVLVKDTAPASRISPSSATFDNNKSKPVVVHVTPAKENTLEGITNGENALELDADYIVSEDGKTVTLNEDYMSKLENGRYPLLFDFSAGKDQTFNLTVKNYKPVVDTEKPVISLMGEATMNLNVGDMFTDPGVTVTDNVDKGLVAVVTGDVVDTTKAGSYTLKYNVSDKAGNAADEVTRTVVVAEVVPVDTEKPVITLNGDATMNLEVGNTFTDPGVTITDNVDKDLVAVVTGTVDTTKAGSYALKYNVSDKAGNVADEVTRTVVVAEAKLVVSSVSAINETTIQLVGVPATVKEVDLAVKKVTLTDGTNTMTASYVPTTLTVDGKANFVLDDSKKLTDAVTYTVSSDWANFTTDTLVAKIATTYVKTVDVSTTGIGAAETNKVYFTAKNQYGEALDLAGKVADIKVTGTLNGVPMLTDEVTQTPDILAAGYVTIKKTLAENDIVTLKFTNKIGTVDVEVGSASYTVGKAIASVATTISNMTGKYTAAQNGHLINTVATEVMPDDQITLSVDVKDQFLSPMDKATTKVRWVVEAGDTLIKGEDGNTPIAIVSDSPTFVFTAQQAGRVQISAYLLNGQKVTYEATIGAKALNALKLDDEIGLGATYNLDENIIKVVKANDGALLTADMIKFDVKAVKTSVDVTAADVVVTAKVRGGDLANKTDIVISAKSTKPGKYTITPYVGASLVTATALGSAFDLTTTVDSKVAKIDAITFVAAELKTGIDVVKDITFRNKHDEIVIFDAVAVVTTPLLKTATVTKSVDGLKNILTLQADAKGVYQVTVLKDAGLVSYTLTFADSTIAKIDAGADITGVVAGDQLSQAKYQAVKFFDQDNNVMNVKKSDLIVSVANPDASVGDVAKLLTLGKEYSVDKDGKVTFTAAADPDNVVAYKVLPNAALVAGTYTVKIASKDEKITDVFTVTVGAVRVAKTVEVTAPSVKVALNGTVNLKIVPKDQYEAFIDETGNIEVFPGTNFTVSAVSQVNKDGGAVDADHPFAAFQVTLTGITKGTNDVVVNVNAKDKDKDGKTVVLATNKVNMTVDSVANLVDSIAIDTTDIKALYSTLVDKEVTLKAIAKDVSGAVVPVSAGDLIWSVVSQVGADGKPITGVSVNEKGVVIVAKDKIGSAVIKVQTTNMKSATVTINFDSAAAVAKAGTTAIVNPATLDADVVKDGIQVALDGDAKDGEVNGSVQVKVTAIDQYGVAYDIKDGIVAFSDDTSIVKADVVGDKVTLTAKSIGTANLYVQYNGDTIKFEVSVNDIAVKEAYCERVRAGIQVLADADATLTRVGTTITAKIVDGGKKLTDSVTIDKVIAAGLVPESITVGPNTYSGSATILAKVEDIKKDLATLTGKDYDAITLSDLDGKTVKATFGGIEFTFTAVL